MKKLNRVGEKHITNEGYTVEVIEYYGAKNCTIKFEDGSTIKNRDYSHIVRGVIKNPYHKSIFNKGFMGVGEFSRKTHVKIYYTWQSMLQRCFDLKFKERQPTYKGVIACKEWHNFQNFAKWYKENYKEGFALDKDILFKGNKIYSPETCCFVPTEINMLFVKSNSIRGGYPIGVCRKRSKFRACVTINNKQVNLGHFCTPEEAFQAYKIAKEAQIKEMAEKYKNQITEPTYTILINYKVEITD